MWGRLAPLAAAAGVKLTSEVIAKARHRHGLVAFRQQRQQNGTAPAPNPAPPTPAAAEEQLPLAAAPAPQLSPDAQAIVGALGQMKGALLSRLTELERRIGVREGRA